MAEVVDRCVNYYTDWYQYLIEDPLWRKNNVLNKDFIRKKTLTEFGHWRKDMDDFLVRGWRPLSFLHVLDDNFLRLAPLAFLDRQVTMRQAQHYTNSTFQRQGFNTTLNSSLSDMKGNGLFRGIYRGTFLNFLQFTGTYYQALSMSYGSATNFMVNFLVLDALFHPFDTLRTRFIADAGGSYKNFTETLRTTKPCQLLNGIQYKFLFNLGLTFAIVNNANTVQDNKVLGFMAMTLAYPFLTLKTISQVGLDAGSTTKNMSESLGLIKDYCKPEGIRTLYRGFGVWALFMASVSYHFPQMWSEEKKLDCFEGLQNKWKDALQENMKRGQRGYGF